MRGDVEIEGGVEECRRAAAAAAAQTLCTTPGWMENDSPSLDSLPAQRCYVGIDPAMP